MCLFIFDTDFPPREKITKRLPPVGNLPPPRRIRSPCTSSERQRKVAKRQVVSDVVAEPHGSEDIGVVEDIDVEVDADHDKEADEDQETNDEDDENDEDEDHCKGGVESLAEYDEEAEGRLWSYDLSVLTS